MIPLIALIDTLRADPPLRPAGSGPFSELRLETADTNNGKELSGSVVP